MDLVGIQTIRDDVINIAKRQRGERSVAVIVINDRVAGAQVVAAADRDGIVGCVDVRVPEQVILVDQRALGDSCVRGCIQGQNRYRTGDGSFGALCVGLHKRGEQAILHAEVCIELIGDVADAVQFQVLDLVRQVGFGQYHDIAACDHRCVFANGCQCVIGIVANQHCHRDGIILVVARVLFIVLGIHGRFGGNLDHIVYIRIHRHSAARDHHRVFANDRADIVVMVGIGQ